MYVGRMPSDKLFIGTVLVTVGGLFLLDDLGVIDGRHVLATWWPAVFLLVAGLALLSRPRNLPAGVLFGVLGLVVLGVTIGVFDRAALRLLWPLALIGLGAWLILARRAYRPSPAGAPDQELDVVAVFFGRNIHSHARAFRGGSIMALFGGVELDLRGATLAAGAALDVAVAFGGAIITVPPGWEVVLEGSAIFGGYGNEADQARAPAGAHRLVIRAQALFGKVEIRVRPMLTASSPALL
jgi:hypothetical protein